MPKHHRENGNGNGGVLRAVLAVFAGLSSVAAVVRSPDWPVTVLLVSFIGVTCTLVGWVIKHIWKQDADLESVTAQRDTCQKDLNDLRTAFAAFYIQAQEMTGGKRRLRLAPIEKVLGGKWHDAMQDAQNAIQETLDEG